MHARITAYRGHLILHLVALASIPGEVQSVVDTPDATRNVVYNSSRSLGASAEAIELITSARRDKFGPLYSPVKWAKDTDGRPQFSWAGGPDSIVSAQELAFDERFEVLAYLPIPNEVDKELRDVIDRNLAS